MSLFLFKLIPPRPTFAQDATETEKKILNEHVAYWESLVKKGIAIIVGPVFDPKGTWGVAIAQVENEQTAHSLVTNDPGIKASFTFEVHPMGPNSIVRN